jgi:hypothetical protein
MNKLHPGLFFVLAFTIFGSQNSSAQLRKGHIVLEGYYGAPNFGVISANFLKLAVEPVIRKYVPELNEAVDLTISGLGPLGGRFEYLVRDRIGLGVDFIYNSTTCAFAIDTFDVNGTNIGPMGITYKMTRLRGHFRFNYHFCNTKRWDIYCGLGAGFNNRIHKFSAQFHLVQDWDLGKAFSGSYPYSARTCLGFRFYPTKVIGIGMELGLGGPLVSGGISARFNPKKKEKTDNTVE